MSQNDSITAINYKHVPRDVITMQYTPLVHADSFVVRYYVWQRCSLLYFKIVMMTMYRCPNKEGWICHRIEIRTHYFTLVLHIVPPYAWPSLLSFRTRYYRKTCLSFIQSTQIPPPLPWSQPRGRVFRVPDEPYRVPAGRTAAVAAYFFPAWRGWSNVDISKLDINIVLGVLLLLCTMSVCHWTALDGLRTGKSTHFDRRERNAAEKCRNESTTSLYMSIYNRRSENLEKI